MAGIESVETIITLLIGASTGVLGFLGKTYFDGRNLTNNIQQAANQAASNVLADMQKLNDLYKQENERLRERIRHLEERVTELSREVQRGNTEIIKEIKQGK